MSTECKKRLQSECPSCWSLLNKKGQMNLPKGLVEDINGRSKSESEAYRGYFFYSPIRKK